MNKIIDDIRYEFSLIDKKKLLVKLVPYIFLYYIFNKVGEMYRWYESDNTFITIYQMLLQLENLFKSPSPSFHPKDTVFGIVGALVIYLIVYTKGKNAKKYRKGEEYGSARWGNAKDIKPYIDPIFEENIILTQSERLMMDGRPKNPKHARNKNVMVVGGSGSGKTRFYVKPNLMQMHSSYVVTDPKGTILLECGKLLEKGAPKIRLDKNGRQKRDGKGKIIYERDKRGKIIFEPYKIKVLNTINFKKSMHYNPFEYIMSEKDILKLVNTGTMSRKSTN